MSRVWKGKFIDEATAAAKRARVEIINDAKRRFRAPGFDTSVFTLPNGSARRTAYELINSAAHAVLGARAYSLELRGYSTLAVTRLARPRAKKGRRAVKLTQERRAIIIADWPAGVPTDIILQRVNALPGPKFTAKQISTTASGACDVRRPHGNRGGWRRPELPPSAPADTLAVAA